MHVTSFHGRLVIAAKLKTKLQLHTIVVVHVTSYCKLSQAFMIYHRMKHNQSNHKNNVSTNKSPTLGDRVYSASRNSSHSTEPECLLLCSK